MDPFAIVLLVGVIGLLAWAWLIARANQGRGGCGIGLRSAREIVEEREALEADDLAQMLEARNARRRRRGEAELTAGDVELQVAADLREQQRRREAYLAERELDQLLEVTNARRRRRGLPERSREDVRREFGPGAAGG